MTDSMMETVTDPIARELLGLPELKPNRPQPPRLLSRRPSRPQPPQLPARLLTRKEAAAYCRLSVAAFGRESTVRPMTFGGSGPSALRWDRVALDAWLDRLNNGGAAVSDGFDWSSRIGKRHR